MVYISIYNYHALYHHISERQQTESNRHQDIEDDNLKEARRWEKHVETKRANAAHSWRARMHCMQSVAEGRMADIERRLQNRKSDALQRKKLQVEIYNVLQLLRVHRFVIDEP